VRTSIRSATATPRISSKAGVNLRLIQEYLGHTSPRTTAIYTHLTREIRDAALSPINDLMTRS
jgi:site-specific recombinase XerD